VAAGALALAAVREKQVGAANGAIFENLDVFFAQAGLEPASIEKVNVPRIWSLVTCVKNAEV